MAVATSNTDHLFALKSSLTDLETRLKSITSKNKDAELSIVGS